LNKLFERVVFAHCVHEHAAFFLSLWTYSARDAFGLSLLWSISSLTSKTPHLPPGYMSHNVTLLHTLHTASQ
jgi:hypothetical protein